MLDVACRVGAVESEGDARLIILPCVWFDGPDGSSCFAEIVEVSPGAAFMFAPEIGYRIDREGD